MLERRHRRLDVGPQAVAVLFGLLRRTPLAMGNSLVLILIAGDARPTAAAGHRSALGTRSTRLDREGRLDSPTGNARLPRLMTGRAGDDASVIAEFEVFESQPAALLALRHLSRGDDRQAVRLARFQAFGESVVRIGQQILWCLAA